MQSKSGYFLSIIVGTAISALLAAALVIAAAKAGITPGVSPLVVLLGWAAFGRRPGTEQKNFLALLQVSGSAGAAVTAGIVFTAPILQITHSASLAVDVFSLILCGTAGALLGWGFVGLSAKQMLSDPRLPAPEAAACDQLITAASSSPDKRPALGHSLYAGILAGATVSWMTTARMLNGISASLALPFGSIRFPLSPLFLGIGALLSVPTALLVFSGGLINEISVTVSSAYDMPDTTYRWVGGAAMAVSVLYSLCNYILDTKKLLLNKKRLKNTADPLLEVPPALQRLLYFSILSGSLLLIGILLSSGISLLQCLLLGFTALFLAVFLSGVGGLLSLQIGSSASPVSGTVFMALLALSCAALASGLGGIQGIQILVPLLAGICVAICAANDSSQDYKTMQLNGLPVPSGYIAQLCGLLAGVLVVPPTLWIANQAYHLGSPELPAPQASFFSSVLDALFLTHEIPWGPVGIGSALGTLAVLIEVIAKRRGLILSSLAFAVGIYLPSEMGVGMLLGAFCAMNRTKTDTASGILCAAGLISGDALCSLGLGVLVVIGYSLDLSQYSVPNGLSLLLLGTLLILLRINFQKTRSKSRFWS